MQLYDMHSHILPEFDDGARSIDESLKLIDCLKQQGVTNICLTPHFYTNEMALETFVQRRAEAFEKFKPYIPQDINIVLGTEVYVTHYLFGNNDFSDITYGRSRYILTEYAYNSTFSEKTMQNFYMLIRNNGLIPVMPHVERYSYLMSHTDKIRELQDLGVVIQTNISNYADKAPFLKKRKLMKMISEGYIDILGSDAHSFSHNTPEVFAQAMKNISDKCGKHTLKKMMKTSEAIFNEALEN